MLEILVRSRALKLAVVMLFLGSLGLVAGCDSDSANSTHPAPPPSGTAPPLQKEKGAIKGNNPISNPAHDSARGGKPL